MTRPLVLELLVRGFFRGVCSQACSSTTSPFSTLWSAERPRAIGWVARRLWCAARAGYERCGLRSEQLVANPGYEDRSGAPNDFEAPDLLVGPSGTQPVTDLGSRRSLTRSL